MCDDGAVLGKQSKVKRKAQCQQQQQKTTILGLLLVFYGRHATCRRSVA